MNLNLIKGISRNFLWNTYSGLKRISVRSDKRIWLFGAWMGNRFADNSRFLFQYLSVNKDKYGLKEIIWISRNPSVVDLVRSMGYTAYLCDSQEGIYYHYKAGVHLICNSYETDIDTKRSCGATKIQLWHGNGIKACGKLKRKKPPTLKDNIWDNVLKPLLIPGRWFYAHWVACSEESKRALVNDSGALPRKIIIANSPRLCPCVQYTQDEIKIINTLKKHRENGWHIIMFLPTFRQSNEDYIAPLNIPGFLDFLKSHNILWIQKNHSVDQKDSIITIENDNIISLDKDFDVNTLYDFIDIFISDYSSATTDAIYKNVVTIDYCPDYDKFSKTDRGFVSDYSNYHIGNMVKSPSDLIDMIHSCLGKKADDFARHKEVRKFLFDNNVADYDIIVQSILKTIKL